MTTVSLVYKIRELEPRARFKETGFLEVTVILKVPLGEDQCGNVKDGLFWSMVSIKEETWEEKNFCAMWALTLTAYCHPLCGWYGPP